MENIGIPVSRRVSIAFDYEPSKKVKADFSASLKAEREFGAKLRRLAEQVGQFVHEVHDGTLAGAIQIGRLLAQYAEVMTPWAAAATRRMHTEVASRDRKQWTIYAREMGLALRKELDQTPTGAIFENLLGEQVNLIKSLPLDAAKRVHELTVKGLSENGRPDEIMEEIMRTGLVTKARAKLIARTETARTASILTQARAQALGCTHFVWETSKDEQVRPSHRALQGKVFAFNEPPVSDVSGGVEYRSLPGQIWNCRCWIRPVLPEY